MLTYENVVTLLLGAAEQQRLNIVLSQEQLDTHALERTFVMTCLPRTTRERDGTQPRVALSFRWDPALTAISISGSEGICDLYHGPDESCTHTEVGCAYDAALELEAVYQLPLADELSEDVNAVIDLAAGTRELLAAAMRHAEDLEVRVQLLIDSDGASVSQLEAVQRWVLDEELHESQALADMFNEICGDIAEALETLAGQEPAPPSVTSEQERDDYGDHLTYLRPPAA